MISNADLLTPSIAILTENFFASLGDNKLDFKVFVSWNNFFSLFKKITFRSFWTKLILIPKGDNL